MSNYPPGVTDDDPYFNDDPDGLSVESELDDRLPPEGYVGGPLSGVHNRIHDNQVCRPYKPCDCGDRK